MPELLTLNEVAKLLRVSARSVERWVDDGNFVLEPVRIGGKTVRFRRRDVERLLALEATETRPVLQMA